MTHATTLENLLAANARLTRIAAQSTGSTVSAAVWPTLSILSIDGPHRIGDLARAARISQPGMTKVVQTLVEDEWVLRIADVADARAWLIAVTPKGRRALSDWRAEVAAALEPVFRDVTDADWAVLERAAGILGERVATAAVAA